MANGHDSIDKLIALSEGAPQKFEGGGYVDETVRYHEGGSVSGNQPSKQKAQDARVAEANKASQQRAKEKADARAARRKVRKAARKEKRATQKEKNIAASKAIREEKSQKRKEMQGKPGHPISQHISSR